jgi:hypothetical protein
LDVHAPRDGRATVDAIASDAAGEIIEQITDPITGKLILRTLHLPGGLLAVEVEDADALALAHSFLPPQTEMAVVTDASGKKTYRFIYRDEAVS